MPKNSEKKAVKLNAEDQGLIDAMNAAGGNKTKAAELLGMKRTTFRDKWTRLQGKNPKEKKTNNKAVIIESALAKSQGNKTQAAELLGIPRSTFHDYFTKYQDEIQGFYRKLPKKTKYVITSAQNATPVNQGFFASLKKYCEYHDAELIVIPIRYKNPTSVFTIDDLANDWWAEELQPYLCDVRSELNKNLILFADIKIQPTATNPLSGFDALGRDKSVILGHTKLMMKTVPVPSHATPKILTTTGCVTVSNYTETKTGKKGDFHHSYSALIVELDKDIFHIRQLNSITDGSFIDLDKEYRPDGVFEAPPALALVMGDTHAQFVDESVLKATFEDKDSIVNVTNPKHLIWHDVLDFYSKNHHHRGNPFVDFAKYHAGLNNVKKELELTFDLINKYGKNRINVFPASNHPDALARWIKETDWKNDPVNAELYLETALYMVRGTSMGDNGSITPDPFKFWGQKFLDKMLVNSSIFLSRDEPFDLMGVDLSGHGDRGPNGSRGSIKSMSTLGVKTITGHSHSPGIYDGACQVGTSSKLRLEYNSGPSSWLHTHCLLYANGKRALINIIKGKYKK